MILPDNVSIEKWTGLPAQFKPRDLMLCVCALSLGFLYLKLQPLAHWIPHRFSARPEAEQRLPRQQLGGPYGPSFTYNQRCRWGEFGCMIYGWPSSGGVLIRECAGLVELKFLGFDPVNPPSIRLEDPEKEDAFCMELRKICRKFWKSQRRRHQVLSQHWDGSRVPLEPSEEELKQVFIG